MPRYAFTLSHPDRGDYYTGTGLFESKDAAKVILLARAEDRFRHGKDQRAPVDPEQVKVTVREAPADG